MTSQPFRPTHKITLNGREILVQVTPERAGGLFGQAYTEVEWNVDANADWEFVEVHTVEGPRVAQFLYQGQTPLGEMSYETIKETL